MSRLRPTRRMAALVLALVAIAGLSAASASQLSVNGGTLQSGVGLVVDCQPTGTPVKVSFASAFSTSTGTYSASNATVSSVDPACGGLAYRFQILSTTGAVIDLASGAATDVSGTVPSGGGSFTTTDFSTVVPAAAIGSVALVFSG